MRALIRWVGLTVVTSATVGGGAAMMYFPTSSSAATKAIPAASPSPDLVTPVISSLTNQAEQLNTEIGAAQSELSRLKDQVTKVAGTHYYVPSAAPVVRVQSPASPALSPASSTTRRAAPAGVMTIASKRPATHTTTGASGANAAKGDDAGEGTNSSSHGDD